MSSKQIKNISLLGGARKKSKAHKPLHNTTGTPPSNVHTPKSIYVNVPDGMILPNSTFPQVSVLTNNVLQKVPLNDFVWLEKTDGLHTNIIIFDNSLYDIRKNEVHKLMDIPIPLSQKKSITNSQTVLDTELYEDKYYVFDASMIEGEDISSLSFINRMNKANTFIQSLNSLFSSSTSISSSSTSTSPTSPFSIIPTFIIKEFKEVTSLPELVQFVNTTAISPHTGNKIDGVIFQRVSVPYFETPTCFKLKRKVMNTIDFKIFYVEDSKSFYLYLYGSYNDILKNRKLLPRINPLSIKHTHVNLKSSRLPKSLYVLFSSPYEEGLHEFVPRYDWDTEGYFENDIEEINELMSSILENPNSFNGAIVEMSLANDGWVPLRLRNDKQFSNGYSIGISNSSVIFNPILGDSNYSPYFAKKFAFDESVLSAYHDVNKIIRKYIIEHSINPLQRKITVLDLAGGRGADELNLYHSGAYSIFAADADKDALVQYVERTPKTPTLDHTFLLDTSKNIEHMPKSILINAIHAYLSENNDSIIDDIKSRNEYPKDGFDVILMNYAIHYLCHKRQCIKALKDLIKAVLKPDGLFIFSCFDGDSILNDMRSQQNQQRQNDQSLLSPSSSLKFKTFEIKLIEPETQSDSDAVWAKMALPTIDESGYRAEPLAQSKFINELNMNIVEHYYPLEVCEINNVPNHELVDDYLSYINVYVMKQK